MTKRRHVDRSGETHAAPSGGGGAAARAPLVRSRAESTTMMGLRTKVERWRNRAHLGASGSRATKMSFGWWFIGLSLLIINWVWLQIFVFQYAKLATTPERISIATLVFNASEQLASFLVVSIMKLAETHRIGRESVHVNFDRYHLTNLLRFAFCCYSAIFKQTLFVSFTDWARFASFFVTNSVTNMLIFFIPMSSHLHRWTQQVPLLQFCIGKVVNVDLLHQRGIVCYAAYMKRAAQTVASLQYLVWCLFASLSDNVAVFPAFVPEAGFDWRQQLVFVLVAMALDWLSFAFINVVANRLWQQTPTYVGWCLEIQNVAFRRAKIFVAAHVVSDVYLGMLFVMQSGWFFSFRSGSSSGG